MSTHSPSFVDIEHYQGIARACKTSPSDGTTVNQCSADLFGPGDSDDRRRFHLAGWINPDRGELFFADRVVLVEGETEERLLPVLARRLGFSVSDTSVVNCGSKLNLATYASLLNRFRIPYVVVHDEDPLPDPIPGDWSEDRIKQRRRTYNENTRIADALDKSLGRVSCCPRTSSGSRACHEPPARRSGRRWPQ